MESQSLSHILSSSNILLALTVLGLLYIVVLYVFGPKYDKREPPAIPHWLPYVGHILALFRHGAKYFEELWYVVLIMFIQSRVLSYIRSQTNSCIIMRRTTIPP